MATAEMRSAYAPLMGGASYRASKFDTLYGLRPDVDKQEVTVKQELDRLPKIVLRDGMGQQLNTFTTLQEAIYRAELNVRRSRVGVTAQEWRLPHGPLPAKPDFSRAGPSMSTYRQKMKNLRKNNRTVARSFPGFPRYKEVDVDDVAFVAESLNHLPNVPSLSFLRQEFLAQPKRYFPIVHSILLHQKLLSETDRRDPEYTFPGFCFGCRQHMLCPGCDRTTKPHYHLDKLYKTTGGLPQARTLQEELKKHYGDNWRLTLPDLLVRKTSKVPSLTTEEMQLIEEELDRTLRSESERGQKGFLPAIPSASGQDEGKKKSGTASGSIDTEDEGILADRQSLGFNEDDTHTISSHDQDRGQRGSQDQSSDYDIDKDSDSEDRSGSRGRSRQRTYRGSGPRSRTTGSELELEDDDDLSRYTSSQRTERKGRLYKAPAPFKLRQRKRRTLKSQSPFTKERNLNLPTGPGFQLKQGSKDTTKFVDFDRKGTNWKEPSKFEVQKSGKDMTKFWSPRAQKKKKQHEKRGRHTSPDSGLDSDKMNEPEESDLTETITNKPIQEVDVYIPQHSTENYSENSDSSNDLKFDFDLDPVLLTSAEPSLDLSFDAAVDLNQCDFIIEDLPEVDSLQKKSRKKRKKRHRKMKLNNTGETLCPRDTEGGDKSTSALRLIESTSVEHQDYHQKKKSEKHGKHKNEVKSSDNRVNKPYLVQNEHEATFVEDNSTKDTMHRKGRENYSGELHVEGFEEDKEILDGQKMPTGNDQETQHKRYTRHRRQRKQILEKQPILSETGDNYGMKPHQRSRDLVSISTDSGDNIDMVLDKPGSHRIRRRRRRINARTNLDLAKATQETESFHRKLRKESDDGVTVSEHGERRHASREENGETLVRSKSLGTVTLEPDRGDQEKSGTSHRRQQTHCSDSGKGTPVSGDEISVNVDGHRLSREISDVITQNRLTQEYYSSSDDATLTSDSEDRGNRSRAKGDNFSGGRGDNLSRKRKDNLSRRRGDNLSRGRGDNLDMTGVELDLDFYFTRKQTLRDENEKSRSPTEEDKIGTDQYQGYNSERGQGHLEKCKDNIEGDVDEEVDRVHQRESKKKRESRRHRYHKRGLDRNIRLGKKGHEDEPVQSTSINDSTFINDSTHPRGVTSCDNYSASLGDVNRQTDVSLYQNQHGEDLGKEAVKRHPKVANSNSFSDRDSISSNKPILGAQLKQHVSDLVYNADEDSVSTGSGDDFLSVGELADTQESSKKDPGARVQTDTSGEDLNGSVITGNVEELNGENSNVSFEEHTDEEIKTAREIYLYESSAEINAVTEENGSHGNRMNQNSEDFHVWEETDDGMFKDKDCQNTATGLKVTDDHVNEKNTEMIKKDSEIKEEPSIKRRVIVKKEKKKDVVRPSQYQRKLQSEGTRRASEVVRLEGIAEGALKHKSFPDADDFANKEDEVLTFMSTIRSDTESTGKVFLNRPVVTDGQVLQNCEEAEAETDPRPAVSRDTPRQTVSRDTPRQPVSRDTPRQPVSRDTPRQPVSRDTPRQTVSRDTESQLLNASSQVNDFNVIPDVVETDDLQCSISISSQEQNLGLSHNAPEVTNLNAPSNQALKEGIQIVPVTKLSHDTVSLSQNTNQGNRSELYIHSDVKETLEFVVEDSVSHKTEDFTNITQNASIESVVSNTHNASDDSQSVDLDTHDASDSDHKLTDLAYLERNTQNISEVSELRDLIESENSGSLTESQTKLNDTLEEEGQDNNSTTVTQHSSVNSSHSALKQEVTSDPPREGSADLHLHIRSFGESVKEGDKEMPRTPLSEKPKPQLVSTPSSQRIATDLESPSCSSPLSLAPDVLTWSKFSTGSKVTTPPVLPHITERPPPVKKEKAKKIKREVKDHEKTEKRQLVNGDRTESNDFSQMQVEQEEEFNRINSADELPPLTNGHSESPELPPLEIPPLPDYVEEKKDVKIKEDRRTHIKPIPKLKEAKLPPPPTLKGPKKSVPRTGPKKKGRVPSAEAPVTQEELSDMTDPLDFLTKYCIIHMDRLPFYERIFSNIVETQTPRYERVRPLSPRTGMPLAQSEMPQWGKHEINMFHDLIVISRGQDPDKIGLSPPEQYLEKICYTLEILTDKRKDICASLGELESTKIKKLAERAKEVIKDIIKPSYSPKAPKKGKKKKKKKGQPSAVEEPEAPSPRLMLGDITDDIIVSRIDEKTMKMLCKEADICQINLEMERCNEKLDNIEERMLNLDGEKNILGMYCMEVYFLEQLNNQKPVEFRRAQSALYNKIHPHPDVEMNVDELEGSLQIINNNLLSTKEFEYLFHVLNLPGRRKLNFKLFSIVAALSEKVTQMDPVVRKLINKMDYHALDHKMNRSKDLFALICDGEPTPRGNATASNLAVELSAGGLTPEHIKVVLSKFNREGSGYIDFMDFVMYIPLFIEIHERIVQNPLDVKFTL